MNLKGLDQVRNGKFYLDAALGKMRTAKPGTIPKDKTKKKELIEKEKLRSLRTSLKDQMSRIVSSFPDFNNLPEFYDRLIDTSLDKDRLRKSLSTLSWSGDKIEELLADTLKKMTNAQETAVERHKKAFIGRVASIMKRLNPHLDYLESARRILLTFPSVKTDTYTLCISGFPNVGKSTLLTKITTARPEIGSYAFTTKSLNIGYFDSRFEKVQVIDSPGTLARFEKMNGIEQQAYLALKYVADIIVFVFDLSEPYPIDDQLRLYENVKEMEKPIIIYFSKLDILPKANAEEFVKKMNLPDVAWDFLELKDAVQKKMKKRFH
ncbi:MAG: GTPase [Candidatus Woesearchaeota archaeon]|jgi:nucleolar GTP-binding protein